MIYAYCRKPISKNDNQSINSIYDWAEYMNVRIDDIIFEEEEENKQTYKKRKLGYLLLPRIKKGDCLIVPEISCIGRSPIELDKLINGDLLNKEIRFVCLSMDIDIDYSNLTLSDRKLLQHIHFAADLQKKILSETTKAALTSKLAKGEEIGGSCEKWRKKYASKSEEEKKEEGAKRGSNKNLRFLRREDSLIFLKILKKVFPEATKPEDINKWEWEKINTRHGKLYSILSLMYICKEDFPTVFRKWDLNDFSNQGMKARLRTHLLNMKKSVNTAGKYMNAVTIANICGEENVGILNNIDNQIFDKSLQGELTSELKTNENGSLSIRISEESFLTFNKTK